ncbi:OmpA family protein [Candidatus Electronema sp. JC]|uniref:OmpA family protein n=1 Tax=Candidatus Electronema sp. JC TaxID=3401570 RepID=UPI003B43B274
MNSTILRLLAASLVLALLAVAAPSLTLAKAKSFDKKDWVWQPDPAPAAGKTAWQEHVRMADNFFVFYDPSTAMDVPYRDSGMTRLEMSKQILLTSNAGLPELNWQTGLYPHWRNVMWLPGAERTFQPYYRLQNYDREAFKEALEKLPVTSSGPPMLQTALMKLEYLLPLPGRTEVFIFTNGAAFRFEGVDEPEPLAQAKKLAKKHDVCFTLISSATNSTAEKLLNDIAAVNDCSQVIDFDTVAAHPDHLFGRLHMPADSPFQNILFAFDKSQIRKEYQHTLDRLGRHLTEHPQEYAVLSGFCDSVGGHRYNIHLSRRRAESARKYLLDNFPLKKDRVLLYWYGKAKPVASNKTTEGRRLNRRVTVRLRQKK